MSIAKKTQSGKKVARQKGKSASPAKSPAKPHFEEEFAEKYPDTGVVHEAELRQFLHTVPLAHLPIYGARFQAVMQALEAARQQPSPKTRRAVVKLIADLEKESRNRRYRQILRAMAAAGPSEDGLNRAYWTTLRIIEMTFAWSFEYMFAFGLYEQRLKASRQDERTARAAG